MQASFDQSLAWLLRSEGGYVDHPKDPGGPTNKGVTQSTYNAWRRSHNLPIQDVKIITPLEVEAIYRNRYWDPISGDLLPRGLDYCTFDYAVNSGPRRAITSLQDLVKAKPDGWLGPATLGAIRTHDIGTLINQYLAEREDFLRGLPTFGTFGDGWIKRIDDVRMRARTLL